MTSPPGRRGFWCGALFDFPPGTRGSRRGVGILRGDVSLLGWGWGSLFFFAEPAAVRLLLLLLAF